AGTQHEPGGTQTDPNPGGEVAHPWVLSDADACVVRPHRSRAPSRSSRCQCPVDFRDDSPRRLSRAGVLQNRPSYNEIVGAKANSLGGRRVSFVIVRGSTRGPDAGADYQGWPGKSSPADLNSPSRCDEAIASGFERRMRSRENERLEILFCTRCGGKIAG